MPATSAFMPGPETTRETALDSPPGGGSTFEDERGRMRKGLFSIGQFSRITGLTVKTIRLYHDKDVLKPAWVDDETGYRYFDQADVERARVIRHLRDLEFPLAEIRELLEHSYEESGAVPLLEKQRRRIDERQEGLARIAASLDEVIAREKEAFAMVEQDAFEIEVKELEPLKVAGLRWKGSYADTGKALPKVCRKYGRYTRGKPLNLYYDCEVKEEGADVESCVPVRDAPDADGFSVHTLPGGRCVSLIHKGPYEEIGRTCARVMGFVQEKGWTAALPYREIYLKGPGMIFRGNPKNYLTEIQILVEAD
jgi:DNA-binding transcriptional MerR regulator